MGFFCLTSPIYPIDLRSFSSLQREEVTKGTRQCMWDESGGGNECGASEGGGNGYRASGSAAMNAGRAAVVE